MVKEVGKGVRGLIEEMIGVMLGRRRIGVEGVTGGGVKWRRVNDDTMMYNEKDNKRRGL